MEGPLPATAETAIEPVKKKSFLLFTWRLLKWIFFIAVFLLSTVVALIFIYEKEIKDLAVTELNKHLNAEVILDPQNIDLTFFSSFPDAAVEFKKVIVLEALKKKNRDTIIDAQKISLRFNLMDVLNGNYEIRKLLLSDVSINFITDKYGKHNFIFWKESPAANNSKSSGKQLQFRLEQIELINVEFSYRNKQEFIRLIGKTAQSTLSGSFSSDNYTLTSKGELFFSDLVLYKRSLFKNKNINFETTAEITKNDWQLKETNIAINQMNLYAQGGVWKKDSIISCDLDLKGKNLDIKSALSLLPENQQDKIRDYDSEGNFYFNAKLKGQLNDFNKLNADFNFGIENGTVKHAPSGSVLTKLNLDGKYQKPVNGKDILSLKNISARINSNSIKGDCRFTDLSDPFIELSAGVNAELSELIKFYPVDTIQSISGKINLHAEVSGKLNDLKNNYAEQKAQAKGEATLENLELLFKHSPKPIRIRTGQLAIVQNDLSLKNVAIAPGENEIILNGELNNFFAWLLKENQPLNITGNASAEEIKIDEFLAIFTSTQNQSTTTVNKTSTNTIGISDKFLMDFDIKVGKSTWDKFTAENISGKLKIKDGMIIAEDLTLNAFDGDVLFTGYATTADSKFIFKGSSELIKVNVNKMFTQMNNFRQSAIQDKDIRGIATVSIAFSTVWDQKFNPDMKKINVSSDILIERGELIDYKPLEALSKFIEVSELKTIKFSTLKTHVDVKDETVVIGKTEIQNTAMNINLSGSHTFNNYVDYHISILMSELMAKKPGRNKQLDEELRLVENDPENRRTVFLRMTGNIDDIKINYDRKAAKEKLKEDIKEEKKTLKSILNEEFGVFKKDSTLKTNDAQKRKKSDQKFEIQINEKKKDPTAPPDDDDDDDDF